MVTIADGIDGAKPRRLGSSGERSFSDGSAYGANANVPSTVTSGADGGGSSQTRAQDIAAVLPLAETANTGNGPLARAASQAPQSIADGMSFGSNPTNTSTQAIAQGMPGASSITDRYRQASSIYEGMAAQHDIARARQAQDFASSTAVENNIAARNTAEENARRFRQAATSLRNVPGGKTQRMFNAAYIDERQKFGELQNQNPGAEFARTPEQEQGIARGMAGIQLGQQNADTARMQAIAQGVGANADFARATRGPQETFGNPVDELDSNSHPIRAQYGSLGSRQVIGGALPVPKSGNGISIGPDGTLQAGSSGQPRLTEVQSKDIGFYTRGREAMKNLGDGHALTSYLSNAGAHVPVIGNKLAGSDYQQEQQAGNEFLSSILRKDSGAAITKQEQETYARMYLPQPGDSADTLKQKTSARKTALDAINRGMGPAQKLVPQDQPAGQQGGQSGNYSHLWE